MSVLVDEKTRVVVQGITGHQGTVHTRQMKEFGSQVVAGVTPGKAGTVVEGVPVFDAVRDAVEKTGANASCIFVPAPFAKDALLEAVDAGIRLCVIVTEHIPFHDMLVMYRYARAAGARIVGPNCPGIASPGKAKVGIIPNVVFRPGRVGVISRSGTLTYEIVNGIKEHGLGQSTCIGLGGDPVVGTSFVDALPLFEDDPDTDLMVLVGEIGGTAEEDAAEYHPRPLHEARGRLHRGPKRPSGKADGPSPAPSSLAGAARPRRSRPLSSMPGPGSPGSRTRSPRWSPSSPRRGPADDARTATTGDRRRAEPCLVAQCGAPSVRHLVARGGEERIPRPARKGPARAALPGPLPGVEEGHRESPEARPAHLVTLDPSRPR